MIEQRGESILNYWGKADPAYPLAGFQYHHGKTLWPHLTVRPEPVEGLLTLEADNRFDDRAVRVEWQNHKL